MRENNAHTRSDSERARPRARLRDAAESVCLCELWLCSVHGRGAAVLSSRLSVQVGLASCRIVLRALASRSSLCCTSLSRYGRRTGHGVAPPQRDPPPRARRTRCAGRRAFHILVLFSKFSLGDLRLAPPRPARAPRRPPRPTRARDGRDACSPSRISYHARLARRPRGRAPVRARRTSGLPVYSVYRTDNSS